MNITDKVETIEECAKVVEALGESSPLPEYKAAAKNIAANLRRYATGEMARADYMDLNR